MRNLSDKMLHESETRTKIDHQSLTIALSRDEARSLTDEVKGDAERLWRKLVELYEGGAHEALGYSSWGTYFETEFGGDRSYAYRVLDAGRVVEALESQSPMGDSPIPNERQARELAPLLKQPDALRETWAEVTAEHPEPTAANVREVVARHAPPILAPAPPKPSSTIDDQLIEHLNEIKRLIPKWNKSLIDPHRPSACRRRVELANEVTAFLDNVFVDAHAPKVQAIPTARRG